LYSRGFRGAGRNCAVAPPTSQLDAFLEQVAADEQADIDED